MFWLDWAALAVSLFNTTILLWLAFTVLLTAEKPTWGVSVAGAGLLAGAAFFISHSAILGQQLTAFTAGVNFWWRLGWVPITAAPLAWYALMLWYCGFWDAIPNPLYRRQVAPFMLSTLLGVFLVGLFVFANPLSTLSKLAEFDFNALPALGLPLLVLAFPLYITVCIVFSLDALLRPAPSGRLMGDQARKRARAWLVAATSLLLVVCVLVGAALLWVAQVARTDPNVGHMVGQVMTPLAWLDLAIALLVGAAVVLLGQAIVSYEIFTGRALPRKGFRRLWLAAVLYAAAARAALSFSLTMGMRPIYTALLAFGFTALLFALTGWWVTNEREDVLRQLRPFLASQRLYDRVTTGRFSAGEAQAEAKAAFAALCREVLNVRQAALLPQGALAGLLPPGALGYRCEDLPLPALPEPLQTPESPHQQPIPLDTTSTQGWALAIPLWNERGAAGLLMLGEKMDGTLFAQEEMEIARASAERLVDLLASVELSRRLMELQRARLAESRVMDLAARRTLHDEILPALHASLLALSARVPAGDMTAQEALESIAGVHRRVAELLRQMPAPPAAELATLGLVGALQHVVTYELAGAFDKVRWEIEPEAEQAGRSLTALQAEVVFYAVREALRNAARHARGGERETLQVSITLRKEGKRLLVQVEDNGVGFAREDAAPIDGRSGLALHTTLMAVIGGELAVESLPRQFTRVRLQVPVD